MSTDPITAAIHDIGRLAIHITCNDIASNGIQPLGIMLAVLLPPGTTRAEIEHMMEQAGEASSQLGVEIIGGHTEITGAVNSPVIVSTAIGRGFRGQSQGSEAMKIGDYLLMTKEAGIEGASSHSGRRSYLTTLADKGTSIHILKTLAGHQSISTTAVYLFSSPSQLKAAADLI